MFRNNFQLYTNLHKICMQICTRYKFVFKFVQLYTNMYTIFMIYRNECKICLQIWIWKICLIYEFEKDLYANVYKFVADKVVQDLCTNLYPNF